MTKPQPPIANEPLDGRGSKASYLPPQLEVLGSLRSATRGTGPKKGDGGQGMQPAMMSDRRAKENVRRIGQHQLGLAIYVFSYLPRFAERFGRGRHVGFMADEVAEIYPDAVNRDEDGYLEVDYGRLLQ